MNTVRHTASNIRMYFHLYASARILCGDCTVSDKYSAPALDIKSSKSIYVNI